MAVVQIWHNPRCSKSRETLALLQSQDHQVVVFEYLKTPPSADDIAGVLSKLCIPAHDLIRTKETAYQSMNLSPDWDQDALIAVMANHPVLIERPIVIHVERAAIGRPPEAVLSIL